MTFPFLRLSPELHAYIAVSLESRSIKSLRLASKHLGVLYLRALFERVYLYFDEESCARWDAILGLPNLVGFVSTVVVETAKNHDFYDFGYVDDDENSEQPFWAVALARIGSFPNLKAIEIRFAEECEWADIVDEDLQVVPFDLVRLLF